MADAKDTADFFIGFFRDTEDPMNRIRVQRFLYFAQAETLVRLGHPLFPEDFIAETDGPAIVPLDSELRGYGRTEPLSSISGSYDIHVFSPEELEILMDTAHYCGTYSTGELSKLVRAAGGPWGSVEKGRTIPKDTIGKYHSEHGPSLDFLEKTIENLETEGYTDPEGRFVHPGGWYRAVRAHL